MLKTRLPRLVSMRRVVVPMASACVLLAMALSADARPPRFTPVHRLSPLPSGVLLPVLLDQSLNPHHLQPGLPLVAHLTQRVPLPGEHYLSTKARLIGTVSDYSGSSMSLEFTTLVLGEQKVPIHVRLLCAADWLDILHTKDPTAPASRGDGGPTNWTTRQIGGDEVYLENGVGIVYNRYSEPVGQADGSGVYSKAEPGQLQHAFGPFSTTATGLHDLPGVRVAQPGSPTQPIVFDLIGRKWGIHAHAGLLLEVVTP